MAELNRKDLISDDALEAPKQLAKEFDKLAESLRKIVETGKSVDKNIDLAKNTKNYRLEKEKLINTQLEFNKQNKEIERLQSRITPQYKQQQKELIKLKVAQQENSRKMREQAKETSGLVGLYTQQSAKLNRLRREYKNLVLAEGENTKAARKLRVEITQLDSKLKQVDATVGQSQRNVGNYASAWRGLGGVLRSAGLIGGITGIVMVLRGAFRSIKEFDQATADLASVIGKTRSEIKALSDDAIRLGSSTKFTATEVSKLQTEFAKLGFTEQEILNVTEATLQLAAATNTELSEAATVAGSTLRAFNLESTETQRLVDVMAKSFSTSALDMEKFSTAMATVAPVANSAGWSIERTTSALGILVDNGIDASTAGTGLRNVLLELSKSGLTYEEALGKIQNATDKNAVSLEMFGKRGATIGTILASNTDKVGKLEVKLNDAGGAAKKMADEQLNTLNGRLTLLSSAWDGLILSIENGEGAMAKFFMGAVTLATKFLNLINLSIKSVQQIKDEVMDNALSENAKNEINQLEKDFEKLQKRGLEISKEDFTKSLIDQQKEALKAYEETYKLRIDREKELRKIISEGGITKEKGAQIEELKRLEGISEGMRKQLALRESSINALEEYLVNLKVQEENTADVAKATKRANIELKEYVKNISSALIPNEIDSKEIFDKNLKLLREYLQKRNEEQKKQDEYYIQLLKDHKQKTRENIEESVYSSLELYGTLLEGRIQKLELENEAFQRSKEKQLEAAEGNEKRQQALREQMAAKEESTRNRINQMRRKQAIADKAAAIASIAISTAEAVMLAVSRPPMGLGPIIGLPLAVSTGVLGAIQIANVIATPIPQFFKGTDSSPEGPAIINEKGPELMKTNDGQLQMINSDKPTLTFLERGTKIFTAEETQQMLNSTTLSGFDTIPSRGSSDQSGDILKELREATRAIKKIKGTNVTVVSDERWNKKVKERYN